MDISKLDTIVIDQDTVARIVAWRESIDPNNRPHIQGLPFNRGILLLKTDGLPDTQLIFNSERMPMEFAVRVGGQELLRFIRDNEGVKLNDKHRPELLALMPKKGRELEESMVYYSAVWAGVMLYISLYKEHVTTSSANRQKVVKKAKKGGKGKPKVTYISTKIYSLNVPTDLPKRSYNITAEGWEVRAHPRTYKNGKTIWIESYPKGKGKTEPKTFKL